MLINLANEYLGPSKEVKGHITLKFPILEYKYIGLAKEFNGHITYKLPILEYKYIGPTAQIRSMGV